MRYIYGGHDFSVLIHLCVVSLALLLGAFLRNHVKIFRKYLIPAPMLGGLFLFLFYNFCAEFFDLKNGQEFLEELMFHLLNISFIAMQLRIPVTEKKQKRTALWQNVTALTSQYGLQSTLGFVVVMIFGKIITGSSKALGLTLCMGFELGPGQAESIAKVWENAPYFVPNATDVGLAMAAIGFVVGSVFGVIMINRAVKKGWMSANVIEKIRNGRMLHGSPAGKNDQDVGSFKTTVDESMDTLTLHLAIVLFTYFLSYLFLAFVEFVVAKFIGGKVLEAVNGLWGINFVFSSLFAMLVRKIIVSTGSESIIDNKTFNRINGIAVDFTVVACLGAIEIAALRYYWFLILTLTVVGILITCLFVPWFCSRLFSNYSFFRMLMIFGSATGTLPTALSLLRVVDPDFDTPVAQDCINSMGVMFVLALPLIALANLPANGKMGIMFAVCCGYVVISFTLYFLLARRRAFAKPKQFFYTSALLEEESSK